VFTDRLGNGLERCREVELPAIWGAALGGARTVARQAKRNDGGRYWDRTSDPCDVKAGVEAQPSDFAAHGRAIDLRLRHQYASYVLARWFNEPKSTVLQSGVSALCPMFNQ
jgi:hypothetical protein